MKKIMLALAAPALLISLANGAEPAAGDWPNYGRTPGGDRHSPLKQIDRANVGQLALAWEYKTGEAGDRNRQSHRARGDATGHRRA